jgi:RNA exonuclease 4
MAKKRRDGAVAAAEMTLKTKKKKKKKGVSPAALAPGVVGASNWGALATKIGAGRSTKAKRKRDERLAASADDARTRHGGAFHDDDAIAHVSKKPAPTGRNTALTDVIALDCEMVGVGEDGRRSILARVSVVNEDGNVVLDTFVAPTEHVTDYRTAVSGVRAQDLRGAPPFKEIQRKMADILRGRILVGHALKNDLRALLLDHPRRATRDTATYRPLTRPLRSRERAQADGIARGRGSRSLKELCARELGLEIQAGEHSSVDDARAALLLYQKCAKAWERSAMMEGGGILGSGGGGARGPGALKGAGGTALGAGGGRGGGGGGGSGDGSDDDDAAAADGGDAKRGKRAKKKGERAASSGGGGVFAPGAPRVDLFNR